MVCQVGMAFLGLPEWQERRESRDHLGIKVRSQGLHCPFVAPSERYSTVHLFQASGCPIKCSDIYYTTYMDYCKFVCVQCQFRMRFMKYQHAGIPGKDGVQGDTGSQGPQEYQDQRVRRDREDSKGSMA